MKYIEESDDMIKRCAEDVEFQICCFKSRKEYKLNSLKIIFCKQYCRDLKNIIMHTRYFKI